MRRSIRTAKGAWLGGAGYALLLGLGTAALQWVDYRRIDAAAADDLALLFVGGGFLLLGIFVGFRLLKRLAAISFDGNPRAQAALGISPRELAVLHELAAGRSNKEIAARLAISPNTVKTHVARLFEKLEATRRTEAINRARELGLLP